MKLSNQDKNIEEIIRNISGKTIEDIDDVLKALMMILIMQYSEGEIVRIPYFGALKIDYDGDEITKEGRVAKLNAQYFPSNEVKLNIGMLEDVKSNNGKMTDIPCIQDICRYFRNQLSNMVERE